MSSMGKLKFGGTSGPSFDKDLDKATSHLLLEPDLECTLKVVDSIRQNDVQPRAALQAIKKKIAMDNPHVAAYALAVLDMCVKNCGAPFHQEIASMEFMEFLREQAKRSDPVRDKVLELIQTWSHAFRSEPRYNIVEDTYHVMKMEGCQFPAIQAADAMFTAERAPELKYGEECSRCRVKFGFKNKKINCRNCGDVFCLECTPRSTTIPKYGIEREVRVCDLCFDQIRKSDKNGSDEQMAGSSTGQFRQDQDRQQTKPRKKVATPQSEEDEELQLAMALSRSEAESKEKEYWKKESEREQLQKRYGMPGAGSSSHGQSPAHQPVVLSGMDATDMDPELARYLNRNFWEKKSESAGLAPSAPHAGPSQPTGKTAESKPAGQSWEQAQAEKAQFMAALQSSLEIFVNRMRSNSQRGRPIANDSSVQSLFNVISSMHPQLVNYIQGIEDKRAFFEGLQDKLTQLRDAREALDSLREEHREKRRREMEELERQRQIQMMQKLEVMRQKKHEYLEMQRQQALQRLQEQEREMAMRFEQQKQLTAMRQMQNYGYPQMYNPQQPMTTPAPGMPMGGAPGMMTPPHPPQTMPGSMGPQGAPPMMSGYGPPPPSATTDSGHPMAGGYGAPLPQGGPQQGQLEGVPGAGAGPGPLQGPPQNPAMFMGQPSAPGQGPYPQDSSMPGGSPMQPLTTGGGMSYPPSDPHQVPPHAQLHLDGGGGGPSPGGYSPAAPLPSMPYPSMPPTMDYDYFNMQSLASNLPQHQQQPPSSGGPSNPPAPHAVPGQPYMGGAPSPQPPPPPIQFPPAAAPPSDRSNNHPQHYHLPHYPLPQQPPAQDTQLISFD